MFLAVRFRARRVLKLLLATAYGFRADVVLVDEASQVPLASGAALGQLGFSVLLFGDPKQLNVIVSASLEDDPLACSLLERYSQVHALTFLDTTYRLSAPLARLIGWLFYADAEGESRLISSPEAAAWRLALQAGTDDPWATGVLHSTRAAVWSIRMSRGIARRRAVKQNLLCVWRATWPLCGCRARDRHCHPFSPAGAGAAASRQRVAPPRKNAAERDRRRHAGSVCRAGACISGQLACGLHGQHRRFLFFAETLERCFQPGTHEARSGRQPQDLLRVPSPSHARRASEPAWAGSPTYTSGACSGAAILNGGGRAIVSQYALQPKVLGQSSGPIKDSQVFVRRQRSPRSRAGGAAP